MGRKSTSKSKEKKLKKKEESAKVSAQWAKVEAANKMEDPLAAFPVFQKYERNGLSVTLETKRVGDLDEDTVNWAYELTKTNMQTLYEQSEWGWKSREKMEEMTEEKAWYLVAKDQDGKPVAFSHFRFDMELDTEVLYCYEIQLCPDVRKKGLGKFMMQILELMANRFEMKSVMLTVFKHNNTAQEFFMNKLKYTVDEISPEQGIYDEEDYSYQILSKLTKIGREAAKEAALQPPPTGCPKPCCSFSQ
ncbi:N-alpha-acetyltransferase 40 [Aplysia californica]|uniref:N-alpha-acetyltransferase 40 n=1 Tax=Aplysia californica TaxID=6500 RepID=A0ABM0JCQ1_APLCA|nr:N-alpha-acetyltransferase 40 [Aplysia californica]